jgi:hypothetical protein
MQGVQFALSTKVGRGEKLGGKGEGRKPSTPPAPPEIHPPPGTVAPGFSPVNPAQKSSGFSPRGKGKALAAGAPSLVFSRAGSDTLDRFLARSVLLTFPLPPFAKCAKKGGTRGFELGQRGQNHEEWGSPQLVKTQGKPRGRRDLTQDGYVLDEV